MSEAQRSGRAALLLVDLQRDFLDRPGLVPGRAALEAVSGELLAGARELGLPVLHVHTVVRCDGADRMRHWKDAGRWECVEGSPGAQPPLALVPRDGEPAFHKQVFSAFDADGLDAALAPYGTLFLAGVYLHACVRASALDAHARGFDVRIVEDAVGSTEPVHAELSREYLERRAIRFVGLFEALESWGRKRLPPASPEVCTPVAFVGARWRPGAVDAPRLHHASPVRQSELVAAVPLADAAQVEEAVEVAARAQRDHRGVAPAQRLAWLEAFHRELAAREDALTEAIVREVGKPRSEVRAEVRRAGAHLESAVRVVRSEGGDRHPAPGVRVRYRPLGVVALVTPWNNPLAIPVGKIAPALGFGNAVVWKPSCRAPETAHLVVESLRAAGVPDGLTNLVFGEARTARHLIVADGVAAVAVTGSAATGRSAAALCAARGRPLQAELGGNNAAVVLSDCDVEATAEALALAAFGFAGQRCTAIRRLVVERPVADRFRDAFVAAARGLVVGDPADEATQVGPLVSATHRRRVEAALALARTEGGRVLCGGHVPEGLGAGAWLAPTVVADLPETAHLVREETFGPVAVIQVAEDADDAVRLLNAVEEGLVATLCTRDPSRRDAFLDAAEAGMLNLAAGPLPVHPDAPFAAWKASGLGPPEHGVWDREFYTRPQAVYGED